MLNKEEIQVNTHKKLTHMLSFFYNTNNQGTMSNMQLDCNICFETISSVNNSTTECGHHFCFKCIAHAMQHSNKCPCCRSEVYELNGNETPNADTNMDNDTYHISNEHIGCVDDIADKLEEEGVTMIDLLSYYNNRYNSRGSDYSMRHDRCLYMIDWLEETIPRIIEEVDEQHMYKMREQYERWLMKIEDNHMLFA